MALIRCPECGREISDRAPACIHCGFPLSEMKAANPLKKVVIPCCEGKPFLLNALSVVRIVTGMDMMAARALVLSPNPVVVNNVDADTANSIALQFRSKNVDAQVLDAD